VSDTTPPVRSLPKDPGNVTALRFAKVLTWLVYAYFVLALIVLTLYFFLLLFNASETAGFTEWVYRSADRAMQPFRGIFPTVEGEQGSVLDFAVLFALIVYGIVVLVLRAIIDWLDRKIREERAKMAWLLGQDGAPT
jgi:uncharacterized protein YggT (Ycf19 family)